MVLGLSKLSPGMVGRLVAAGLTGALLLVPVIFYAFGFDQATYAGYANILLNGGLPYRDACDFRPPGILYIYWLAFVVFGETEWSVRLLEIVALALACVGLQRVGECHFGSKWAGLLSAVALPLLYLIFEDAFTCEPESFQIPLIVWSFALWPMKHDMERVPGRCYLAGALAGLAVLFKSPAIVFPITLLVLRLFQDRTRIAWKRRIELSAITLAGIVSIPCLVFGYYAVRGVLGDAVYELFVFAPQYASVSYGQPILASVSNGARHFFTFIPWCATLLGLLGIAQGWAYARKSTLWLLGLTVLCSLTVGLQMKFFRYHFLPLLPCIAMCIGLNALGWAHVASKWRTKRGLLECTYVLTFALLFLGFFIQYLNRTTAQWSRVIYATQEAEPAKFELHEVAARIRKYSAPSESLFVWGNKPQLYWLSHRRLATPFPNLIPILPEAVAQNREQMVLGALRTAAPPFIVVVKEDAIPEATGRVEDSEELLSAFPHIQSYVSDEYELVEVFRDYRLWRRKRPDTQ